MLYLQIATWIQLALGVAMLGVELWAFINAVRFRADAYEAAFGRPKGFWVAMTAGALFVGLLSVRGGISFLMFTLIAVCIAGVFLADQLPKLKAVTRR